MVECHDLPGDGVEAPSEASAPKTRECLNCPAIFEPNPKAATPQVYCSNKCRDTAGNRNALQGKAVMPLLKAWRLSRNSKARREIGAQCLTEVCAIVDRFIDLDRAEGRESPKIFRAAEHLLGLGRYIDRERRRIA